MKKEIKVPSLGESIVEATIGQILAPDGTLVQADAEVVELETDKVNQVLYAPQAGRVQWGVKSGDTVKIGQVIGTVEGVKAMEEEVPREVEIPPVEVAAAPAPKIPEPTPPPSGEAIRYMKEEFLRDLQAPREAAKEAKPREEVKPKEEKLVVERETRRSMSKIRKVIAQRMVEAQRTMAMLSTFNEVDLTQIIQLREKYKELFQKRYGCRLGFMSFFVKAVVSGLQVFPDLNSYIDGEDIVHREYYDIGVAVGTEKGVIVPIIRNCDQLKFAEIEQAIENYAKKAREGTLTVNDLQGGGFTITNGGVYGSLLSTPILMPPQCGILGMHKIEKRPVVVEDQVVIRPMMYVALSYDHRLIDGREAVSFLVHLKNMLEDPSRLLLDI